MEVSITSRARRDVSVALVRLASLAREIDGHAARGEELAKARDEAIQRVKAETEFALSEYKANLLVIRSFIKIAKGNARVRKKCPVAIPYDRRALTRIQALIDIRSKADDNASALYYQATGQQVFLQEAIDEISESAERKVQGVRAQYEKALRECERMRLDACSRYAGILREPIFDWVVAEKQDIDTASPRSVSLASKESVVLGFSRQEICLPQTVDEDLLRRIDNLECVSCHEGAHSIDLPVLLDIGSGGSLMIQTTSCPENTVDKGMQSVLIELLSENAKRIERIDFLDPVNLNSSALGVVDELTRGERPMITPVPTTREEHAARLSEIDAYYASVERKVSEEGAARSVKSLLYLKHFPEAYDSNDISIVRRICRNATRYGALVILSGRGGLAVATSTNEALSDIMRGSVTVRDMSSSSMSVVSGDSTIDGFSFRDGPREVSSVLKEEAQRRNNLIQVDNGYVDQVGGEAFGATLFRRHRGLVDLPIGLDSSGKVVTISLEDESFATFICGASRSGKSTLLHTILSDVFLSKHPDEVEVWLVDFKMTEFSRYVGNVPPHVKYIILDESPELVFDLIDKLIDNLSWRQNRFKDKGWEKIEDAWKAGQYMPELLIVIDEFSVMSKIVADAALEGKDYRDKMQLLLSKGAALGFRFIFSSQGFTKGTRGLSEYARDQIQQRIAMKTTYEEIKSTLDLPDVSPSDRMEMEELDRHYALLKVPYGFDGSPSRLKKSHVLFFQNREEQLSLLDEYLGRYVAAQRPSWDDPRIYVDKHPVVIDGNERKDYASAAAGITAGIDAAKSQSFGGAAYYACIGEPRRMKTFCPIELVENHRENVLVLSSPTEQPSVQSIIASVVKSLTHQGVEVHLCMSGHNQFLSRQLAWSMGFSSRCLDTQTICSLVSRISKSIGDNVRGNELLVLLDIDSLFEDLAFSNPPAASGPRRPSAGRPSGQPDLLTQLAMLKGEIESMSEDEDDDANVTGFSGDGNNGDEDYDARDDIREIITRGPRLGYHVMLIASDPQTLKNVRIAYDMFRHKVLFRNQRADLRGVVQNSDLAVLADIDSDCYRYTNGVDGVTFRPYAHSELGIFAIDAGEFDDFYFMG